MQLPHLLKKPEIHPSVYLQTGVIVLGDVHIGPDSSVWFNSVIRGDVYHIRIGARTNVQDMCMIHVTKGRHATIIGDEVTLGHRVTLHGCTIRDRVLVGMGAIVMDRAEVGEDCIIGAGALVTEGTVIPPGSLAVGSPARVKRPLTDAERAFIRVSAQNYIDYANAYRAAGYPGIVLP
jgi:carbonic anhydrase/acetyltransferase-like protein (isoleucine patch superfamily)